MKYRNRHTDCRRHLAGTPTISVAVIVLVSLASMLLSGCGDLLSSARDSSNNKYVNPTRESTARTTTTLSLHERVQQEQDVFEAALTPSTSLDATSQSTSASAANESPATVPPTVVLSDGSSMSPEEFEDIEAYVLDIGPLVEGQAALNADLDPDLSFNFLDVTSADIEAYKEATGRQRAIWEELSGMQAPARMAESHQLRTLAAGQLYEAASTMIVEIEGGKYFSESSTLMAAGRSQFETGLNTWNDAQFGLVLWDQLVEGSYIR